MAEVTNPSHDALEVPRYGLIFEPGETQIVDDVAAETLPWPFVVKLTAPAAPVAPVAPAVAPVAPVTPAVAPVVPAEPAAPVAPAAAPVGGNAQ